VPRFGEHLSWEPERKKVAGSKSVVEPYNRPPTTAATKYHTLRVYRQVEHWKGETLPPDEWGLQLNRGSISPNYNGQALKF